MMSLSASAGRPKFLTGVRNESTLSGTSGAKTETVVEGKSGVGIGVGVEDGVAAGLWGKE